MQDSVLKQQDEKGRFMRGNRLAKGDPAHRGGGRSPIKETAYIKCMRDVVTVEEWEQICKRAVIDAKDGNWRARDWLSNYLLGKPAILVDATVTARVAPIAVLPPLEGQAEADLMRDMMIAALERGVAGNIEDFTDPVAGNDEPPALEYEDAVVDS